MKIKFVNNPSVVVVANVFDQTQKDLFDSLYNYYGENFHLIIYRNDTNYKPAPTRKIFYEPYNLRYEENTILCKKILEKSNILIICSANFKNFRKYFKNKLIIKCSERFYKTKTESFFDRIKRKISILLNYQIYEKYKPLFFAIGQYAAKDIETQKIFRGRTYEFAYFSSLKKNLVSLPKKIDFSKQISFCWIGKIINWKKPELVLDLAKICQEKNYPFHFTMYSVYDENFEKFLLKIKQQNLDKIVSLEDKILHDKVYKEIDKYDFSLVTSGEQEGWGLTTQDAMARGTIPVSNAEAGSAKMFIKDNETGFLFCDSAKSKEELLDKIFHLDCKSYYNISNNSLNFIRNDFNVDIIPLRLFEIYKSICLKNEYHVYDSGLLKNIN